ncbi:MAG TPA: flagellar basal-body rod protein FlgF [Stellaceae bacterium]
MSEQALYVLMTGAAAIMDQMTVTANNLANANTTAYKAQKPTFQSVPYVEDGQASRAGVVARDRTADFTPGAIVQTGRALDLAVEGQGWIGVQGADGQPAYTRNGSLQIGPNGTLMTNDGHPVLGQGGGPISLPPLQNITIGEDGTISGVLLGQDSTKMTAFDRIMLANPPAKQMTRRTDGLFADATGAIRIDGNVRVKSGALEQSNVDSVGMMMNLIENQRMFQMQTGLMHTMGQMNQGNSTVLSLQ